ncbi:MAG: glycoside hydrolase family 15 protein [Gemmatimonadetes bacterium]|nr:glycoside hydrolase family 15 protein [Gemmatimonadota bacterium]
MARSLVLGNGRFLLTFDQFYRIRDIYFPYIGIENHTEGHPFRFGLWVDGATHWVDESWEREIRYEEGTLVGRTALRHRALGLELRCRDVVDFEVDLFVRELHVRDLKGTRRLVRVFLHQDFYISGSEVGDTALYDPEFDAILHYKRDRYFLTGGGAPPDYRLTGYACGKKQMVGAEGTWRDAEGDGLLSGNPIAQGSVDSMVSLDVTLEANGEEVLYYWMAAGERYGDLLELDAVLHRYGPAAILERSANYWRLWLEKHDIDYSGLPEEIAPLYKTSLLVMRTHVDRGGAVIASADSEVAQIARDHYGYMWPRDAALIVDAFDRAGYPSLAQRFFNFAGDLIKKEGYFLHKYQPDRSLGSSWHPWVDEKGQRVLPIQEDQTGLVVWALWRHFDRVRDVERVQPLYHRFLVRAADFLAEYRDPATGLPLPSWDLWEERRGVLTFTCAAVWAGLDAATRFAHAFGDVGLALRYGRAADEVKQGILRHLWDEASGRFLRMLVPAEPDGGAEPVRDATPDSSLFGLHFLGVLDENDPRLVGTLDAVIEALTVRTEVGGLARYRGDHYHAVTQDWERVPGNPWFIAQCWHARWRIARAQDHAALEAALEPLEWAARRATSAGLFPEQLHPFTGEPLSVTPLIWSHAEFVTAVREYLARRAAFDACPACGSPRVNGAGRPSLERALR